MAEIFALLGCYKAQIGSNYSVLGWTIGPFFKIQAVWEEWLYFKNLM